ncbi:MAG: amylo-alpha-1,6-glucosidase [Candidatus Dormibacteraceae bacterium]
MLEDRVILKEDRVFVVSDLTGDVAAGNELGLGLYESDTRFLSVFELRINGERPILLNNTVDRAYVATFQLVNPTLVDHAGATIRRQSLSLRRTRFVHRGLHERLGIQNCNRAPVEIELELAFGADFLDIFEVRGYRSQAMHGTLEEPETTETGFRFVYRGLDGVRRETEVVLHPVPHLRRDRAVLGIHLAPQQTFVLLVDILTLIGDREPEPNFDFDRSLESLESSYQAWNQTCTRFESDNEVLDQGLLWRSREDLRILCDDRTTGPYPTAGVPWYAVPFGRDAIITSVQTLGLDPELGRGTLRFLAQHQGTDLDESREEEPGKILHELRIGELANLRQIPHTPYYGSVDATPLFLVLMVEMLDWTGDLELFNELLPNLLAALAWIDDHGDLDRDGFIEYVQHARYGVRNQGWKDSPDSLVGADGEVAPLPAALVEVQGYAYHARRGLARVFRHLGRPDQAERLEAQASAVRARFDEAFWMPEEQFYAQALDSAKRQVPSISSNPGHGLWSEIVHPDRAAATVARLLAPDLFSGWGIRTLSTRAISYNPMSYHNGSVWPHDNSIITAGLVRYGFRREAERVARAVLEAGMRFPDDRLPELYCGFNRDSRFNSGPSEYLVSCSPQAWGAGAAFHLLCVVAGVQPDVLGGRLRIDPLETCLFRRLRVEGMRVANGILDFTVEQGKGSPRVRVDRSPAGLVLELPG